MLAFIILYNTLIAATTVDAPNGVNPIHTLTGELFREFWLLLLGILTPEILIKIGKLGMF